MELTHRTVYNLTPCTFPLQKWFPTFTGPWEAQWASNMLLITYALLFFSGLHFNSLISSSHQQQEDFSSRIEDCHFNWILEAWMLSHFVWVHEVIKYRLGFIFFGGCSPMGMNFAPETLQGKMRISFCICVKCIV